MLFESRTARLTLRRPTEQDRDLHSAVHSDPRLYAHAPHVLGTPETNAQFFDAILGHWATHGFGYWVACDRDSGMPLGWVGVQRRGDYLNLYYRFVTEAQRRGLAREATRAAVTMATEWWSDHPVRALVKDHNRASVRTAEAAGLVRTGALVALPDDLPGEPPSSVFEAPRVSRVGALDDADRAELLDLWQRVNDAGGAVGFLPGAPRSAVAELLAVHDRQVAAGDGFAGALRDPAGDLVGWGWCVVGPNPLRRHAPWLYRVMVDPARQGSGQGSLLLAGLHRLAREDGAEQLLLSTRSGAGVTRFYARHGYEEVGRVPGLIRVAPGDDRDEVFMARRLDGGPLRIHGGD
jgi:RimJ/RimL family protein N-acetyltransferase/ribosomal protein S18 acetylase RimI-like enzyme